MLEYDEAGQSGDGQGTYGCVGAWQARRREARMERARQDGASNGPDRDGKPWPVKAGHDVSGIGRERQARIGGNGLESGRARQGLVQRGMAWTGLARLGATEDWRARQGRQGR
jgi:hypothetical protein